MKRVIRLLLMLLLYAILAAVLVFGAPRLITEIYARPRMFSVGSAPAGQVAIVFGAGLRRDGTPTAVLRDRVETAAQLYFAGKVKKLLMSGDNRFIDYNEPGAMHAYAVGLGVPEEDIVLDYAGRRTYDTCYRAREIFKVDEVLLVTQAFHLPRAVYTCGSIGLKAYGVAADLRTYSRRSYGIWTLRELPATLVAILDVNVRHPVPVLGNPEPIFPSTDSVSQGD